MKWITERNIELLEAIESAMIARKAAEVGVATDRDRAAELERLRAAEKKAMSDRDEFLANVREDFLFALRVTMDSNSLALSHILDEAYPNFQVRALICEFTQLAKAVAALEAKVK